MSKSSCRRRLEPDLSGFMDYGLLLRTAQRFPKLENQVTPQSKVQRRHWLFLIYHPLQSIARNLEEFTGYVRFEPRFANRKNMRLFIIYFWKTIFRFKNSSNFVYWVFWVADYEFTIRFSKFKMADPTWRSKI